MEIKDIHKTLINFHQTTQHHISEDYSSITNRLQLYSAYMQCCGSGTTKVTQYDATAFVLGEARLLG
jgi:hypothetical protein